MCPANEPLARNRRVGIWSAKYAIVAAGLLLIIGPQAAMGFSVGCIVFGVPPALCDHAFEVHQGITKEALSTVQFQANGTSVKFGTPQLAEINDANADVDRYQWAPFLHFDNESIFVGAQNLSLKQGELLNALQSSSAITVIQARALRALLGGSLHPLQDFYAHSNWVNVLPPLPDPTSAAILTKPLATTPCDHVVNLSSSFPFPDTVLQQVDGLQLITSGHAISPLPGAIAPSGKCAHGFPQGLLPGELVGNGINKDFPFRPFYDEARGAAVTATQTFVNRILADPLNNPDSVCMLMTDSPCPTSSGCTSPAGALIAQVGPIDFNGTNFITLGGGDFGTGPFSLAARVNWSGTGGNVQNIFRHSNFPVGGAGAGYWIRIAGGKLEFFIGETVGIPNAPRAAASTGFGAAAWHHVAGTKDLAGNMKLYVDGQIAATASITPTFDVNNTSPFTVGAWNDRFGPTEFFIGTISDIEVFGRTLSATEVQSLSDIASGQCP
jgi:concanavalin A-like lectin/glucanase superfamily protein